MSNNILPRNEVVVNSRSYKPTGLENMHKPPSATAIKNSKRTDPVYKLYGGNYFPVSPRVVHIFGLRVAVVLGRIMSYCQMDSHHCTASYAKLARETGMCLRSVNTAVGICLECGLIEVDPNWELGTTRRYNISDRLPEILKLYEVKKAECEDL